MSINKLEELEKLTELKNKGIITEAEFEFKKFELLNKVNANNILQNKKDGSYLLPILSFLIAFISFIISLDPASILILGGISELMFFIILSFILGTVSLSTQTNGTFLAVLTVILSILSGLILLGTYSLLENLLR